MTTLIELLFVEHLDKDPNPRELARLLVDRFFQIDKRVQENIEVGDYGLQISEAATAIIDGALASVLAKRPAEDD